MSFGKRPRRFLSAWPFFFLAAAGACAGGFLPESLGIAQQPSDNSARPIQSSSDLVLLDVSVLDGQGEFYSGLARADFHVLDNGAEKPLQFFDSVEAPEHVLVLVETSPAVYIIREQHLQALSALLEGLGSADQAALVTYADVPRMVYPFSADKAALQNVVGEPNYTIGGSQLNFFDTLRTVVDWFPLGPGKKAIVALTTGLDTSSPAHWDALERKLRGDDVVIFSVALGGPLRGDSPVSASKKPKKKSNTKKGQPAPDTAAPPAFAQADVALRSLAQITGGRTYFPQSPTDFVTEYREIASVLRHQYVLGIAPDHDGAVHKLSVEIAGQITDGAAAKKHEPKTLAYRAFYRDGYLAPSR